MKINTTYPASFDFDLPCVRSWKTHFSLTSETLQKISSVWELSAEDEPNLRRPIELLGMWTWSQIAHTCRPPAAGSCTCLWTQDEHRSGTCPRRTAARFSGRRQQTPSRTRCPTWILTTVSRDRSCCWMQTAPRNQTLEFRLVLIIIISVVTHIINIDDDEITKHANVFFLISVFND